VRQVVCPPDVAASQRSDVYYLRRSRGYAPNPLKLPWKAAPQILATGPELKNTFCLTKDNYAFLSHHIGDMENYETLQSFEDGMEHFEKLFRIEPEAIACDLHPNYLATRYAQERAQSTGTPIYQIQHHHAHIAACMADNSLGGDHPVIGVSFDGTGYGDDGAIWGGEFLLADYNGYQRFAHLEYTPLPGGDAATRKPARIALAQLWQAGIDWDEDLPAINFLCGDDMTLLRSMLENDINCPQTSSMGRLFDAVAALAGIRGEVNYEGQAAIEFEALADSNEEDAYHFEFDESTLKADDVLRSVIADLRSGNHVPLISAKFHNGLANAILQICQFAKSQFGVNEVALSGGVWQNMTLLRKTILLLEQSNFKVYIHRQVPANDGGIALGQAVIAAKVYQR
jgi:hydrogenase maturation protein HypF